MVTSIRYEMVIECFVHFHIQFLFHVEFQFVGSTL